MHPLVHTHVAVLLNIQIHNSEVSIAVLTLVSHVLAFLVVWMLVAKDVAVEEDEGIASDEAQDSSSIGVSSSILGMFKVASSVDRQEKRILASRSMGEILSPQQTPPASMGQNEDIIGAASEERVSLSDVDDNNSEATTMALPLQGERFQRARMQPKSPTEEDALAAKYASIESVEERAYQILVDLGMVEERKADQ